MRAPGVSGGHHEKRCTILDLFIRFGPVYGLGGGNGVPGFVHDQAAYQSTIVQLNLLRSEQLLESEIGRIASASGTNQAGIATDALGAAVIRLSILGLRNALKR